MQPARTEGPRRDIVMLTRLRGVLALWVVVFHVTLGFELTGYSVADRLSASFARFMHAGPLAVDSFFMLSGFILSYTYADAVRTSGWYSGRQVWRQPWPRFLAMRLARIYPVHVAVLAGYAIAVQFPITLHITGCGNPVNRLMTSCERFSVAQLGRQLTLTSTWFFDNLVGWNIAAWSISSEWFAYLLFPVFIAIAGKVRGWLAALVVPVVLAAMIWCLQKYAPPFHGVADDYSLLRVVPEFLTGCLLFQIFREPWFEQLPWPIITIAALAFVGGSIAFGHPMLATFGLATLVLALASNQPIPIARVLATSQVQWLGRISYSLYMVHLLIVEVVGALVLRHTPYLYKEPARVVGSYVGITIVCLVVAGFMTRHVEEPARARVRRWIDQQGT